MYGPTVATGDCADAESSEVMATPTTSITMCKIERNVQNLGCKNIAIAKLTYEPHESTHKSPNRIPASCF